MSHESRQHAFDILEVVASEAIEEFYEGVERLTNEQVIEAFKQAVLAGDFIRHVMRSPFSISQCVTYIPYAEKIRLEAELEQTKAELAEARERISELAHGAYDNVMEMAARLAKTKAELAEARKDTDKAKAYKNVMKRDNDKLRAENKRLREALIRALSDIEREHHKRLPDGEFVKAANRIKSALAATDGGE